MGYMAYVKVKVTAHARKEVVEKVSSDTFKMSVKEKAERNMANMRVKELLAQTLNVPVKHIRLISGHTSPSKIFSIQDYDI